MAAFESWHYNNQYIEEMTFLFSSGDRSEQGTLEARNIAVNCWSREGSINTSFNLLRGLLDTGRGRSRRYLG